MSAPSSMRDRRGGPQATTDLAVTGLLALLLPVFAWAPLAFPGYFVLHSGFLPIFNLNDLMQHLTDPSWAPLVGQAHDLWRGERALPYLLAVAPRLLGVPAVTAVRLVFGLSLVAGALGMYGWARRCMGAWPGLLAAFVYVLWPVNLAAVHVRGAFAEAVFLGLMPWVLWAAARAAGSRRVGPAAAFALLMAATFWTQAGLAVWLSGICLIYLLVEARRVKRAPWAALVGWLGGWLIGLAGLAPVIARHGWGVGAGVVFTDHFVYPHQLLWPGWGFGPSTAGPDDTLTFQFGIVAFGLALFALVDPTRVSGVEASGGRPGDENDHLKARLQQQVLILSTAIVLLLAFLSSTLAAPLWRAFSLPARTLTYPWQLLLLAGPWAAMLAGLGGRALAELWPRPGGAEVDSVPVALPLYAGLLALALLGSAAFLDPQTTLAGPPDAPVAIFGENEIALLRARVRGAPGPGGTLILDTEWQALRPVEEDYTVFFHAVGPDGTMWGQADAMPRAAAAPTGGWQPGQVLTDTLSLTLQPAAPAGEGYSYPIGLYLWQTGQRVPAGDDDKVVLQP